MGEFVKFSVDKATGVGTIRLDRKPMNAINDVLTRELGEAAQEATLEDACRSVIVYGGEKIFAAGADIKEMAERTPQEMMNRMGLLQAAFNAVQDIPKVVIAAINGYALGGGCELALACDFRVIAENGNIGQPEILLGIIPGAGGTQRLPRLVGPARAKDIIFTGRFLKAYEAMNIGLVDVVVPPEDVLKTATEMAERFANGPTIAIRAAKIAINHGLQTDLQNGMLIEREVFTSLFATEDQKIGMRTFVEEGPGKAKFVGR
ncbi:MAG: enoyl-CoA hydratase/isomerase family protein [Actinomycetota bacterium]